MILMDSKKKKLTNQNNIYIFLMVIATFFIGIGYASINSISLEIHGLVTASPQEGIFITDVSYLESNKADLENTKITNIYQNNLNSKIVLENDENAVITYQVIIHNSADYTYQFEGVEYIVGEETYSNENIIFELNGLEIGDIITSSDDIEFTISFRYRDVPITDCELKSLLNFKFSIASYVVATYNYSGSVDTFIAPHDGVYKLEVWGAQGGSTGGNDTNGIYRDYLGGTGGYSSGMVTLTKNQNLYIVVGGQGTGSCVEEYCIGGYNGGGNSGVSTEDTKNFTCSGGGATHVALENRGTLVNYELYQSEVLIVAGGGGGGYYHEFGEEHSIFGGAGGGLLGKDGELSGYKKDGVNIVANATGGSQVSGGIGGYRGKNGSFGLGGSGDSCDTTACGSSGGGGGWYGGGAAGHSGSGGGSGYIENLVNGITMDGTQYIPTYDGNHTMIGNTGNGYAKITFISES